VLIAICSRRKMPANCSLRPPRYPYLPTWPISLFSNKNAQAVLSKYCTWERKKILFKTTVLIIEAKSILHEYAINFDFD